MVGIHWWLVGLGLAGFGCAVPTAMGQWNAPNPVVSFEKTATGLEVKQKDGVLRLEVDAEDLLHVTYSPPDGAAGSDSARPEDGVVIKKVWPAVTFDVNSNDRAITLSTTKLRW
jgi:hypothetical protein